MTLEKPVVLPKRKNIRTRHGIQLVFQVLNSEGGFQCASGCLSCLTMDTIIPSKGTRLQSILWVDENIACQRSLARLGIEPRLSDYITGALPLSYLAMGDQLGRALIMLCMCLTALYVAYCTCDRLHLQHLQHD